MTIFTTTISQDLSCSLSLCSLVTLVHDDADCPQHVPCYIVSIASTVLKPSPCSARYVHVSHLCADSSYCKPSAADLELQDTTHDAQRAAPIQPRSIGALRNSSLVLHILTPYPFTPSPTQSTSRSIISPCC